jgi:phage anti-repressor protein
MRNLILTDSNVDLQSLVEKWIEDEKNGVQYPVDFEIAWQIAGYSTKANAKAKGLLKMEKDIDFSYKGMKSSDGGRFIEVIGMTCDAFKHFCLMARTKEGRMIRQYFIEAEKELRGVKESAPLLGQKINEMLSAFAETTKKVDSLAKDVSALKTVPTNSVIPYISTVVNTVRSLDKVKDQSIKKNLTERIKAELGVTELDEIDGIDGIKFYKKSKHELLKDKIYNMAEKKADWVAPRDIMINISIAGHKIYSEEVKQIFEELANQGKGEVKQTSRTLKFKIYPDSALTKIIYH